MTEICQHEVTVVGSCSIDLVAYAHSLPNCGETIFGSNFEKNYGGKGANQAVQCARLGINVAMCGKVGNDQYGTDYRGTFLAENVCVDGLLNSQTASTGIACISVADNGSNAIIIIPGSNTELNESEVRDFKYIVDNSKVLLCQNEISEVATMTALEIAAQCGVLSVLNPAPAGSPRIHELIGCCDIVCPNETELESLTHFPAKSNDDIVYATRQLMAGTGCGVVIVTLGSRGAYVATALTPGVFLPAPVVHAVDTVGAGDSFIGSLASHISRGSGLHEAVQCALALASMSVTRNGAQKSYACLSEIGDNLHPLPPNNPSVSKSSIRNSILNISSPCL